MTSSDEGDKEFSSNSNKRRRVLGSGWSSEERESAPSLKHKRFQYPTDEPEQDPGHGLYAASSAEGVSHGFPQPDPLPPRYSTRTPEHPEDPFMGLESLLQRVQRENDNQYGLGRTLPALGGGSQPTRQQELDLLLLQEQQRILGIMPEQRPSSGLLGGRPSSILPPARGDSSLLSLSGQQQRTLGIIPEQRPSSGLLGGDPLGALPPVRGDSSLLSSLSSGTPSASLYEQYMRGIASSETRPPYDAPLMDSARGVNLTNPLLSQTLPRYGATISGSSDTYPSGSTLPMSDVARSQARGMEPLLQPSYNELLAQGRAGLPSSYAQGTDLYMDPIHGDSLLAQRYPLTLAAMGRGLPGSELDLELERAQIRREIMTGQAGRTMGPSERRDLMNRAQALMEAPPLPPDPRAITLYLQCDEEALSQYQCVVRKQIELFAAKQIDVDTNAQGRNKPIVLGQVGIRCLHCSTIHPKRRARGGTYYPSKYSGFYQAAQNMASGHLCEHCKHVPAPLRRQLLILRERKSSAGGGKDYWADAIKALGVVEDRANNILRFKEEEEEHDEDNAGDNNGDQVEP